MDEDEDNEKVLELDELSVPLTVQKKAEFLRHLSGTCNITKSAKAVGISRALVYVWKDNDEQFALDVETARAVAVEALEDEAHRRAFDGCLKVSKNGVYKEYSDTLAIFLLKAHKPDRYNERIRNEISGPGGAPLNMDDTHIAAKLDMILKAAQSRRAKAEAPKAEERDDDFDDLC